MRSPQLTNGGRYDLVAAATTILDPVYVDDWPALLVDFRAPGLGQAHKLAFEWSDDFADASKSIDTYELHRNGTVWAGVGSLCTVRHLGRWLRVTLHTVAAPSNAYVRLWHTDTPLPAASGRGAHSELLVKDIVVGAGATVDEYIPPYVGPALLWAWTLCGGAAFVTIDLRAHDYDGSPATSRLIQPIWRGDAASTWRNPFVHQLPPYVNFVRCFNPSGADSTFQVAIHALRT